MIKLVKKEDIIMLVLGLVTCVSTSVVVVEVEARMVCCCIHLFFTVSSPPVGTRRG